MKRIVSLIFWFLSLDHVQWMIRTGIEILAKLLFSFSIIAFNTIKLPVIFNMIKLIGQINIFKLSLSFCPKFSLITIIQPWIITIIWYSRRFNTFILQTLRLSSHDHILVIGLKYFIKGINLWSIFNEIYCTVKNTISIYKMFC